MFYGKLEFINDLITFQGISVKELKEDFHEAVDEYVEETIFRAVEMDS